MVIDAKAKVRHLSRDIYELAMKIEGDEGKRPPKRNYEGERGRIGGGGKIETRAERGK